MLRRVGVTAISILTLTAGSACSLGAGGGQPTETAAPTTQNVDPALKVDSPKNLKGITDACQLLTPEQRAQLGAGAAEVKPSINAEYKEPTCEINGDAYNATIDINTNHGGMTRLHAGKDKWDNFTPTKIAGFPAVRLDDQQTLCRVATGIADNQSLEVYYSKNSGGTPEMDDACGYAERITTEVLKNVPDA